jgi:hypothetical protein
MVKVIIVLLGAALCAVNDMDHSDPLEKQGNSERNRQWRRTGDDELGSRQMSADVLR